MKDEEQRLPEPAPQQQNAQVNVETAVSTQNNAVKPNRQDEAPEFKALHGSCSDINEEGYNSIRAIDKR